MEAGTAASHSTGSKTIADLMVRAAEQFADRVAVRHKVGDDWRDVTYAEVGDIVREIGLGLIDLGIAPGERVSLLCNTRPEWTYCDFAITSTGAVVVPIYPTNSPEECEWVAGNSESMAIVCEDASQVAKVVAVRERLPALRTIVVIDPAGDTADAIALDEVRERGRRRAAAELEARTAAVTPDDPFTFIYTSGTTGPPKGCVLTHGNYRRVVSMLESAGAVQEGEVIYLFLPLAHAYALLIQLVNFDIGTTIAYYGGDTTQIVPELQQVGPTYLPSVPASSRRSTRSRCPPSRPRSRSGCRPRRSSASRCATCRSAAWWCRPSCSSPSRRPRSSCSRTCAPSSAGTCARPSAARPRSPRRSSSSSTAAACPCSRATA